MTINLILNAQHFSDLEIAVLVALNTLLSSYYGQDFTDTSIKDLANELKWSIESTKGVVGSLVKKGIIETWDNGKYDLVIFKDQEEMEYEKHL